MGFSVEYWKLKSISHRIFVNFNIIQVNTHLKVATRPGIEMEWNWIPIPAKSHGIWQAKHPLKWLERQEKMLKAWPLTTLLAVEEFRTTSNSVVIYNSSISLFFLFKKKKKNHRYNSKTHNFSYILTYIFHSHGNGTVPLKSESQGHKYTEVSI